MINNQLYLFFIYILSGIAISILFDVFRVLRKSIKTSNLFTYIEDVIFWLIVGIFLIWEIFTISYGELRGYIFIGLIVGIIFYLLTLSKFFIKINFKLICIIKTFLRKVFNYIKKVISFLNPILKIIIKPFKALYINLKNIIKTKYKKEKK